MITLLLIILIASYFSYRKAFYSSPKRKENIYNVPNTPPYAKERDRMLRLIEKFDSLPYEPVYTESFDGLRLFARYYHIKDGAPLQIQFHGYRGTAMRDYCGGNDLARKLGQNTLVVDQRASGKSEGTTICFGIKEKYDCLSWINYAKNRFGDIPIVISGVSMGGATVLMASELELPENVRCIIADCPFSSPEEIIAKETKEIGIPPKIGMIFVKLGALIFGNLKLSGSAVEAVGKTKIPILLIHGENDTFVPCEMSRKIHAANPKMIRLETFPDAGHGISYMEDTPRYEKITSDFFKECGL